VFNFSMKRVLVVVPAVAMLTFAGVSAAQAAPLNVATAEATCDTSLELLFSPALSTEPQSVAAAGTGVATCSGTVDGETIDSTVAATLAADAVAQEATCFDSAGAGGFTLTVTTTSGGTATISGAVEFALLNGQVVLSGQMAGTGTIEAADGDCVTTPISQASVRVPGAVFTV